jgi:hypothetical protein
MWNELLNLSHREYSEISDPQLVEASIDELIKGVMTTEHSPEFHKRFVASVLTLRSKISSRGLWYVAGQPSRRL